MYFDTCICCGDVMEVAGEPDPMNTCICDSCYDEIEEISEVETANEVDQMKEEARIYEVQLLPVKPTKAATAAWARYF